MHKKAEVPQCLFFVLSAAGFCLRCFKDGSSLYDTVFQRCSQVTQTRSSVYQPRQNCHTVVHVIRDFGFERQFINARLQWFGAGTSATLWLVSRKPGSAGVQAHAGTSARCCTVCVFVSPVNTTNMGSMPRPEQHGNVWQPREGRVCCNGFVLGICKLADREHG